MGIFRKGSKRDQTSSDNGHFLHSTHDKKDSWRFVHDIQCSTDQRATEVENNIYENKFNIAADLVVKYNNFLSKVDILLISMSDSNLRAILVISVTMSHTTSQNIDENLCVPHHIKTY